MKHPSKIHNHEVWQDCPTCGGTYDIITETNCPFCKTLKNKSDGI